MPAHKIDHHVAAASQDHASTWLQVREWLHESLYDPLKGYFTGRQATPVGILERPLDVPALWDFADYQAALRKAYLQLQVCDDMRHGCLKRQHDNACVFAACSGL